MNDAEAIEKIRKVLGMPTAAPAWEVAEEVAMLDRHHGSHHIVETELIQKIEELMRIQNAWKFDTHGRSTTATTSPKMTKDEVLRGFANSYVARHHIMKAMALMLPVEEREAWVKLFEAATELTQP